MNLRSLWLRHFWPFRRQLLEFLEWLYWTLRFSFFLFWVGPSFLLGPCLYDRNESKRNDNVQKWAFKNKEWSYFQLHKDRRLSACRLPERCDCLFILVSGCRKLVVKHATELCLQNVQRRHVMKTDQKSPDFWCKYVQKFGQKLPKLIKIYNNIFYSFECSKIFEFYWQLEKFWTIFHIFSALKIVKRFRAARKNEK